MTTHAARRGRVTLTPTRDDLVDAGFVVVLMLLALVGFRTTFSGSGYLAAGVLGVLLGLAIAYLAGVLGQPMIAVAAATVVVFFLAGGAVALRATAIAGIVPSGSTFHGLANESVRGWKDLLTTVPPVSGSGPLLVLPYLLGILGTVGAFCLARRTTVSLLPATVPLLVLAIVILLGTSEPAARLIQGGLFVVVALGWGAYRASRSRGILRSGSATAIRLGTSISLLALAGVVGSLAGPDLPGLQSASRTVLRSYVTPPTNLDRFPSPLAGYRKYKEPTELNAVLMRVSGLPASTPLRIATLDNYNGSVWSASNGAGADAHGAQDAFEQVGNAVPGAPHGRSVTVVVMLAPDGYSDVWLPSAGFTRRIEFSGQDASSETDSFRYNFSTGTGLVLDGLRPGDSYHMTAVLPSTSVPAGAAFAPVDENAEQSASFVADRAAALGGNASSPQQRLDRVMSALRAGFYSDGIKPGQQQYLPGHYQSQMARFLSNSPLVGDDEQYASALALMANSSSIGIPARVVIGAFPEHGVVRGRDVRAWVQVELSDGDWRDILPKTFIPPESKTPHVKPQPQQPKSLGQKVPPPLATHPKAEQLDSSNANSRTSRDHKKRVSAGSGLPGWLVTAGRDVGIPLLIVAALLGLVIGGKTMRRRRRRTRGSPATRLSRGWTEILDHARDLGTRVPSAATRREQAALLGLAEIRGLADTADSRMFGPSDPRDGDAAEFWARIGATRRQMSGTVGRRRRWLAAINPVTFRFPRPRIGGGSA